MSICDTGLTRDERAAWLFYTSLNMRHHFIQKFNDGMEEHQGDIGELSIEQLLKEMENEALDQLSYIYELQRKLITNKSNEQTIP